MPLRCPKLGSHVATSSPTRCSGKCLNGGAHGHHAQARTPTSLDACPCPCALKDGCPSSSLPPLRTLLPSPYRYRANHCHGRGELRSALPLSMLNFWHHHFLLTPRCALLALAEAHDIGSHRSPCSSHHGRYYRPSQAPYRVHALPLHPLMHNQE
jgi:hypothetical protein